MRAGIFFSWLVVLLCYSNNSFADSYISHSLKDQSLLVQHEQGMLEITALHDLAFEVRPLGSALVREDFPSFAKDPEQQFRPAIKVINSKTSLTFATKKLAVKIDKATLQLSFIKNDQIILAEEAGFFATHSLQGFRFKLDEDEALMGTGERVLGMNRRGHKLPLYNRAHYGYETYSEQMNFSIPAVMSTKKYIILYDNPAKGFIDLGKSEKDILQFEAVGGRQAYIFIAGDTYPDLIHQFVKVTGKQPLPPRWAFGNHASRFGYRTQEQVVDTVERFRQAQIPVDSVILDLYWFGKDIKGHMGNLDWDRKSFSDPDKMISDLTKLSVKTTLITEPFILTSSNRWQEALESDILTKNISNTEVKTFDFYFGNTGLIDVFNEPAAIWFKDIYKDLAHQGVHGVWGDLGEPEVHPSDMLHTLSDAGITATSDEIHNVYGHQWAKLVRDAMNEVAPNTRPFILMRAGYAGSQRFGMIPWTGDVARTWSGLKPQPELTMQMGLLGMAYTHSDLGGFAGGETFDAEMYTRWLQYGVFQPIYRPHAQDNIAPEVVFHDKATQQIVGKYIKLRYRLLPYLYSMAYQNSMTGMPLMRPMFFEEVSAEFFNITDQFMWGDAFLVKAITDPGVESTKVTLPKGQWTDYWTDTVYDGGTVIDYPVTLENIPVFVRGGSIIPTVNDLMTTESYSSQALNLDVYYEKNKLSTVNEVYEDDGVSENAIAAGKYEKLIFNGAAYQQNGANRYSLSMERQLGSAKAYVGMPEERNLSIRIHHWPTTPINIMFDDSEIALFTNFKEFKLAQRGAFFDKKNNIVFVKFNWNHQQANKVASLMIK
ncbi:glycoside hydrolase family 31 protein [Psychrosphaera aestuarii]|uniref:glycoside hydrolase family 31 protein n=1 Tax=Psychrosphaera aestuarii TaxID=1266052 RepID=UPI001B320D16|nr:TIM-barrel domain-containing protein [Psychrosphaera aestuarii]